jgi:hypothetical protein
LSPDPEKLKALEVPSISRSKERQSCSHQLTVSAAESILQSSQHLFPGDPRTATALQHQQQQQEAWRELCTVLQTPQQNDAAHHSST